MDYLSPGQSIKTGKSTDSETFNEFEIDDDQADAIMEYRILQTLHLDPGKLSVSGYIAAATYLLVKKPESEQPDMRVVY